MKAKILLFLSIFCNIVNAQWQGDTAKYIITNDSLQTKLDTIGDTTYLSKPSNIIENATWEFRVQMGFNPSNSNYAAIYLVSENTSLNGNGYFVRIGHTADDISLCKQNANNTTVIIDGSDDATDLSSVDVKVRITLVDGLWSLYTNIANAGEQLEGTIIDETFLQSSYFGVKSVYTKTRADKFTYSEINITGTEFVDNIPPTISSVNVLSKNKLELIFNENITANYVKVNNTSATTNNDANKVTATFSSDFAERDSFIVEFEVEDLEKNVLTSGTKAYYVPFEVIGVNIEDETHISIFLNKETNSFKNENIIINGKQVLSITSTDEKYVATLSDTIEMNSKVSINISDILDINGDKIKSYTTEISYVTSQFGDIVFNEIMYDPEPVVGTLPKVEYIEIYNNSMFSLNLEEWILTKLTDSCDLPAYQLGSNEYLVLGSQDAIDQLPNNINKLAVSGFITLNNTDMSMQLKSKAGTLIDFVNYDNDWHESEFKGKGGFSLERIDVNNLSQIDNWTSSASENGGTPGFENSVTDYNPDEIAPFITKLYALNNTTLKINISEPILKSDLENTAFYSFSNDLEIKQINALGDLTTEYTIILSQAIDSNLVYKISIEGLTDLSGNEMESSSHSFAVCAAPKTSDIVINEIMPYPLSEQAEYVEIYNNSDTPFSLFDLFISQRDDKGAWKAGKQLAEYPQIIEPDSFIVLTDDAFLLAEQYQIPHSKLIEITSFPSLGNEKGNIGILLSNAMIIDELNYSEEWHSNLLSDTRGVALERINPDYSTDLSNSWFSASSLVNYGTPGYQNSQDKSQDTANESKDAVSLNLEYFTPDGDGNADYLTIKFSDKYENGTARIKIFNQRGREVHELTNNALINAGANIIWDGSDNLGDRCAMGPYIVWVEIVTANGEVITEKLEVVVSAVK